MVSSEILNPVDIQFAIIFWAKNKNKLVDNIFLLRFILNMENRGAGNFFMLAFCAFYKYLSVKESI